MSLNYNESVTLGDGAGGGGCLAILSTIFPRRLVRKRQAGENRSYTFVQRAAKPLRPGFGT
jgi:hypothetical protein